MQTRALELELGTPRLATASAGDGHKGCALQRWLGRRVGTRPASNSGMKAVSALVVALVGCAAIAPLGESNGHKSVTLHQRIWPGGDVYMIRNFQAYDIFEERALDQAIAELEANTPIRFHTVQDRSEAPKGLVVTAKSTGLTGFVFHAGGRAHAGAHANGSLEAVSRSMRHELGHVVGLLHTLSRRDRDVHVDVFEDALSDNASQYGRRDDRLHIGPFDPDSVMMYASEVGRGWCLTATRRPDAAQALNAPQHRRDCPGNTSLPAGDSRTSGRCINGYSPSAPTLQIHRQFSPWDYSSIAALYCDSRYCPAGRCASEERCAVPQVQTHLQRLYDWERSAEGQAWQQCWGSADPPDQSPSNLHRWRETGRLITKRAFGSPVSSLTLHALVQPDRATGAAAAGQTTGTNPIVLLAIQEARSKQPSDSACSCEMCAPGLEGSFTCLAQRLARSAADGEARLRRGERVEIGDVAIANGATFAILSQLQPGEVDAYVVAFETLALEASRFEVAPTVDWRSPPIHEGFVGGECRSDSDCLYGGGACVRVQGGRRVCSKACNGACPTRSGVHSRCVARADAGVTGTYGTSGNYSVGAPEQVCAPVCETDAMCATGMRCALPGICVPSRADVFPAPDARWRLLVEGVQVPPTRKNGAAWDSDAIDPSDPDLSLTFFCSRGTCEEETLAGESNVSDGLSWQWLRFYQNGLNRTQLSDLSIRIADRDWVQSEPILSCALNLERFEQEIFNGDSVWLYCADGNFQNRAAPYHVWVRLRAQAVHRPSAPG